MIIHKILAQALQTEYSSIGDKLTWKRKGLSKYSNYGQEFSAREDGDGKCLQARTPDHCERHRLLSWPYEQWKGGSSQLGYVSKGHRQLSNAQGAIHRAIQKNAPVTRLSCASRYRWCRDLVSGKSRGVITASTSTNAQIRLAKYDNTTSTNLPAA